MLVLFKPPLNTKTGEQSTENKTTLTEPQYTKMNSTSDFPNFRPKFVAFFEVSIPTGLTDPRDKQQRQAGLHCSVGLLTAEKPWKGDILPFNSFVNIQVFISSDLHTCI